MRAILFAACAWMLTIAGVANCQEPLPDVDQAQPAMVLEDTGDETTWTDTAPWHPLDRLWVRVDYLHWWMEGYSVPPLVAVGSPPATTVLGNQRLDTDGQSGIRAHIGYLLAPCRGLSVEADFFLLEQGGGNRSFLATPGAPLFRPFFNTNPAVNALDFEQADTVNVSSSSQVSSAGVLLRKNICCYFDQECVQRDPKDGKDCSQKGGCCRSHGYSIDLLGGYRHFRINEALTIQETATVPVNPPTVFDLLDRFETDNHFDGGELGLTVQCFHGCWALDATAKVALGNNHEEVIVSGRSIPPIAGRVGGLLAQPTNSGVFTQDNFAAIPQLEVRLRRQLTQRLSFSAGYSFIFISHLVRPGDQIDFNVDGRWLDPNLVPPFTPPATSPERRFERSDAWLQGIDLSLEWNY